MNEIKRYYRGALVTLYKIKEYDSLKVQEGCEAVECRGDIWVGFCSPYGVYAIYAADTDKIQIGKYSTTDLTLSFGSESGFPEYRILNFDSNASSIEFDEKELMWKIHISMGKVEWPESVRKELDRIWSNARDACVLEESLKRAMSNSFYGLAAPLPPGLAPNLVFKNTLPDIKDVIFNPPATIVFWYDGTKTVVKAQEEDFDPEKGLAMAISKKALGNEGNYYETIKKWLAKESERLYETDIY